MRLREARVAWNSGRYDDASQLLADESLREFLPAKRLARDVAGKIIERARSRFASGDTLAGWKDLVVADRLGGQTEAVNQIRHSYADAALHDARKYLAAGEPASALTRLEKLQKRGLADEHVRACVKLGQLMQESVRLAAHGHFAEALAANRRALSLAQLDTRPAAIMTDIATHLEAESGRLESAAVEYQRISSDMHTALLAENWSAVLSAADALLAIAPQHSAAVQARRRAWKAVGMDVTRLYSDRLRRANVALAVEKTEFRRGRPSTRPSTRPSSRSSEVDTVAGNEQPQRALLWVDAVGGFLVCLDDCVAIGQPSAGEPIALPILADLSRRHAVIRRDAGAYVLEPLQQTLVNGHEIREPIVLADNALIQLGDNVRIRFNKPHALSATAKLTLESHHKTQPSVDAVLLMADSCVLGPNRHCHINCRAWQRDVVVYRQGDQLFCRADEPLSIDGVATDCKIEVPSGARIEGEDFSFAWEKLV
ncbi:MAG TPA: FHA domain-containing protein [Lacipirellulaceae bacterium]|nr:FHA domain-containing protein [Lacipirellulaceae bacterium]